MPTLQVAIDASGAQAGANQFSGATRRVESSAGRATRGVGALDARMTALSRTSQFLSRTLGAVVGAFAAIAAIRAAIRTIAGFEQTMATVQAVTRATAEDFERLTETARELGATTRFSAREAGEGLLFLSRAGFTVEESISAVGATLNLAQAGMLDLGDAADFASNIVSQFNLAAEETVRVVDALVIVSNRSNTNVRQLAEAMKFAGPFAGALGISIEETAAAIGALGDSGIQATMAGTNLRAILAALLEPTTKGEAALRKLGIALDDVDPSKKGLIDTFQRFAEAELGAAEALAIFGRRNVAAALVLTRSADKIQELTDATAEFGGEAERVARIMDQTLTGAFLGLRSVIEEVFLQVGEGGLQGGLTSLVRTITGVLRVFTGMADSLGENRKRFEALAERVRRVAVFFGVLIAVRVVPFFISLAAGIIRATFAMLGFNTAVAANPLGLLATLIAAAATALFVFRDRLITVRGTTATVGDFIVATWQTVRDVIIFAARQFGGFVVTVWELISRGFGTLVDIIRTSWRETIGALLDALRTFANTAIAVLRTVGFVIGDILGRLGVAARALGEFDVRSPIESLARIGDALREQFSPKSFLDGIRLAFQRELDQDFIGTAIDFGKNLGDSVGEGIFTSFADIKSGFTTLFSEITDRAQILVNARVGITDATAAAEAIVTAVTGAPSGSADPLATLAPTAIGGAPALAGALEVSSRFQGLAFQFKSQQQPIFDTARNTKELVDIARRQERRDVRRAGEPKANIVITAS